MASQQLPFDVMKEMAILEQEEHIIVTESRKMRKYIKRRQINTMPSSNMYQRNFDKRVYSTVMHNHNIYILSICTIREQHSVCVCVVHIDILYYSLTYYISPGI